MIAGPSVSMMQKVIAIVLLPFKLHGILTVPRCLILEPPYATRMMTFDWFNVFVCRWRPYSHDTCTDIFKGVRCSPVLPCLVLFLELSLSFPLPVLSKLTGPYPYLSIQ